MTVASVFVVLIGIELILSSTMHERSQTLVPLLKSIDDDYDVYKVDDDCQAISQKQDSNEFNKNNYHP